MERAPIEVQNVVKAAEGYSAAAELESELTNLPEALTRAEAESELETFLEKFNFEDKDAITQESMLRIILRRFEEGPNDRRFLAEAAAKRLHELEALNDYLREVRLPPDTKVSFQVTRHV